MTVEPVILKDLWEKSGLYFEWSRVRFTEFIGIKECRTCAAFGHTAKDCPDKGKPTCGDCLQPYKEGHLCRVQRCKNCVLANEKFRAGWGVRHSAFDSQCMSYQRQREIIIKRTDYGFKRT
ncbi:hypothetical protein AVEN_159145-1 [Araneus ventricosus]|uniref:CCHC-type domain-containing protein n=1 Tax=Araneus ventricosus TaxID=182803 RepID=A0A4Y2VY76_ARAVE|nr:hypothetical protein AVEN_159145-1 [Araneus ventricosus]